VRVARWYVKKDKVKEFSQGDLLWKLILPIGSRDQKYGKWEGPYRINRCVPVMLIFWKHLKEKSFPGL
jgi:hypothetical protein